MAVGVVAQEEKKNEKNKDQQHGVLLHVDSDDDEFWAEANYDIIDQMVEQHTRERQTQEKKTQALALAQSLAPASNNTSHQHHPLLSTSTHQWQQVSLPSSQVSLDTLRSESAAKDGTISLLRDRLGKSEHLNITLKRQLSEERSQPARSLVQKTAALHLEQQVKQLKQQLAFKDEEIIEARRMRLQREEKLHRTEQEASKLAANLKELEASHATEEAERLLRMQGGGAAGGGGKENASSLLVGMKRTGSSGSPAKRPAHGHAPSPFEVFRDDGLDGGKVSARQATTSHHHHRLLPVVDDARSHVLTNASDLVASITSRMYSKDSLEGQAAQALCLNVSMNRSLQSISQVLLGFIAKRAGQARGHAAEFRKIYGLGNGTTCLDSAVRLLHVILFSDHASRRHAASRLQGQDDSLLLKDFVSLLSHCSCNGETSSCIAGILAMVVTCFECGKRAPFAWLVGRLVSDESSSEEGVMLAKGTLLYHLLESRDVVTSVVKSEGTQAATFRFLERAIEFEAGAWAVNRQGFSICALLYRQAMECQEGTGLDEERWRVLLARFGKGVVSVLKVLGNLLSTIESCYRGQADITRYDDMLATILDALSLFGPDFAILEGIVVAKSNLLLLHETMALLQLVGCKLPRRGWHQMRCTSLAIPSLFQTHQQQKFPSVVEAIEKLSEGVYQQVQQHF